MFWSKENNYQLEKKEILNIVNNLTEGLLVFDNKSKLSLINPKAENILGIKKEDVLGKNILNLSSFPGCEKIVSVLGGGIEEISKREVEIEENFILEIDSIKVGEHEKVGALVILRDITREKKAERMKTEFVTLAAHQLRTPMSGIKWSLRMVLDGEGGKLTEKQKEVLEKAYYTNDKVIELINDLLNVAKIEEGKYISKTKLERLEELIERVVEKYKKEIDEKGLDCRIEEPSEDLPKVMMDRDKMEIAFSNILKNSISYTLSGGKITVSITKEEKYLKVEVKDTGVGIPRFVQERIFEKFFRSKNVMKIETEGTGLGLYITKNIIKAHGGRIWFESEEGKGTSFFFTLPVKKEFGEYMPPELY